VIVPKEKEAESKELFKINQFNLIASDMMSLNRTLPDYRMDAYVLCTVKIIRVQGVLKACTVLVTKSRKCSVCSIAVTVSSRNVHG